MARYWRVRLTERQIEALKMGAAEIEFGPLAEVYDGYTHRSARTARARLEAVEQTISEREAERHAERLSADRVGNAAPVAARVSAAHVATGEATP